MDELSPAANPLEEGWATMGAIYRAAWEQALRAPADRGAVSAVLGDALARMLRLTEAAEALVFGAASPGWPVASKAEYASVAERIEGVLERLANLEGEISWPVAPDGPPEGPLRRSNSNSKRRRIDTKGKAKGNGTKSKKHR